MDGWIRSMAAKPCEHKYIHETQRKVHVQMQRGGIKQERIERERKNKQARFWLELLSLLTFYRPPTPTN